MRLRNALPDVTSAPSYHRGPVVINAAGVQVVRAVGAHASARLGRRGGDDVVQTLQRDGIVVLHDYLAPGDFGRVRAEYDASRTSLDYVRGGDHAAAVTMEQVVSGVGLPDWATVETIDVAAHESAFPAVTRLLRDDARVAAIVESAGGRPVRRRPRTYIHRWARCSGAVDRTGVPIRGEYMLHADTHYPTFKVWLYLNDIDESNGAFVYAPGSHRMSLRRLRYEYRASIDVARARRAGTMSAIPYGLVRADRSGFVDSLPLRAVTGPANTLVIANTSGFHKRGDFSDDRPRETVEVTYRELESLGNRHPRIAAALSRRSATPS